MASFGATRLSVDGRSADKDDMNTVPVARIVLAEPDPALREALVLLLRSRGLVEGLRAVPDLQDLSPSGPVDVLIVDCSLLEHQPHRLGPHLDRWRAARALVLCAERDRDVPPGTLGADRVHLVDKSDLDAVLVKLAQLAGTLSLLPMEPARA